MKDVQILVRRILTLAKSRGAKNDKASVFGAAETAADSFLQKPKKLFETRRKFMKEFQFLLQNGSRRWRIGSLKLITWRHPFYSIVIENTTNNIKSNHDGNEDGDEEDNNNSKSRNINQVNNGQDWSSKDNSCFNAGVCIAWHFIDVKAENR